MKWFIALNEVDPGSEFEPVTRRYELLARVAAFSARKYAPSLEAHLVYNGQPNRFTAQMRELGVAVHHHRLSFQDAVEASGEVNELWRQIAKGAMLRLDLPLIVPGDETVLYTDTDIIFLDDPGRYAFPCDEIAIGPEFNINDFEEGNTGVMVINLGGARALFAGLRAWTQENLRMLPDFDQSAVRHFCKGRWAHLSPLMNWKPYWGVGETPVVVHFHGPKPDDFSEPDMLPLFDQRVYNNLYSFSPEGYRHHLSRWRALRLELEAVQPG